MQEQLRCLDCHAGIHVAAVISADQNWIVLAIGTGEPMLSG
jgi:hypothetical protein